jgi:hypothetical protein
MEIGNLGSRKETVADKWAKIKNIRNSLPQATYSKETRSGLLGRLGDSWDEHIQHRAWISPSDKLINNIEGSHETWMKKNKGIACKRHQKLYQSSFVVACEDCLKSAIDKGWIRKLTRRIYQTDGSEKSFKRVIKHINFHHPEIRYSGDPIHVVGPGGEVRTVHQYENFTNVTNKLINENKEVIKMPVGVVKTKEDEKHWSVAKEQAKKAGFKEGSKRFYKYTMGIFKKMSGKSEESVDLLDIESLVDSLIGGEDLDNLMK